jgi:hypothetical protein
MVQHAQQHGSSTRQQTLDELDEQLRSAKDKAEQAYLAMCEAEVAAAVAIGKAEEDTVAATGKDMTGDLSCDDGVQLVYLEHRLTAAKQQLADARTGEREQTDVSASSSANRPQAASSALPVRTFPPRPPPPREWQSQLRTKEPKVHGQRMYAASKQIGEGTDYHEHSARLNRNEATTRVRGRKHIHHSVFMRWQAKMEQNMTKLVQHQLSLEEQREKSEQTKHQVKVHLVQMEAQADQQLHEAKDEIEEEQAQFALQVQLLQEARIRHTTAENTVTEFMAGMGQEEEQGALRMTNARQSLRETQQLHKTILEERRQKLMGIQRRVKGEATKVKQLEDAIANTEARVYQLESEANERHAGTLQQLQSAIGSATEARRASELRLSAELQSQAQDAAEAQNFIQSIKDTQESIEELQAENNAIQGQIEELHRPKYGCRGETEGAVLEYTAARCKQTFKKETAEATLQLKSLHGALSVAAAERSSRQAETDDAVKMHAGRRDLCAHASAEGSAKRKAVAEYIRLEEAEAEKLAVAEKAVMHRATELEQLETDAADYRIQTHEDEQALCQVLQSFSPALEHDGFGQSLQSFAQRTAQAIERLKGFADRKYRSANMRKIEALKTAQAEVKAQRAIVRGGGHLHQVRGMLASLVAEDNEHTAKWRLAEEEHERWCAEQKAEAAEASAAELHLRQKIAQLNSFVGEKAKEQQGRLREFVGGINLQHQGEEESTASMQRVLQWQQRSQERRHEHERPLQDAKSFLRMRTSRKGRSRQHEDGDILRSYVWRLLERRDELKERVRTPRLHREALQVTSLINRIALSSSCVVS